MPGIEPVQVDAGPGATELVEEGRSGLLAPIQDAKALSGRLREMFAATPPQRAAMGEAGRAYLRERFGKAAIVDAYLSLYGRLLAKADI